MKIILIVTCTLLALAAAFYYADVKQSELTGPQFDITDTTIDLGTVPLRENREVTIPIANTGQQPGKVSCISEACGINCCFDSNYPGEQIIMPSGHIDYQFKLHLRKPGPFKVWITIFVEEGGIRQSVITVQGIAMKQERQENAAPKEP